MKIGNVGFTGAMVQISDDKYINSDCIKQIEKKEKNTKSEITYLIGDKIKTRTVDMIALEASLLVNKAQQNESGYYLDGKFRSSDNRLIDLRA